MIKKILLTRPVEDSLNTKKKLEKIGFETVIIPLIKICKLNHAEIPLKEYDLVIFTSRNAAKIFDIKLAGKGIIFSIGDGTTRALKERNFSNIKNSKGNSRDIIVLFKKIFNNRKINILHPCAKNISMELENYFYNQGSNYYKLPIYEVKKQCSSNKGFRDYLESTHNLITIYSSKTALSFVETIKRLNLEKYCKDKIIFALSSKISGHLADLNFKKIYVPDSPSERRLIEIVRNFKKGEN